jgi:protein-S-isoprenylcysteine O-methyltransferase Ste14
MKQFVESMVKVALLVFVWFIWWLVLNAPLSNVINLSAIVGSILLVFPIVLIGRMMLDRYQAANRAIWVTTFVHYAVGGLFGVSIIRAITTHQDWSDWTLPIPTSIGLFLVMVTGLAGVLVVANLAIKGLGAPFAIALSKKLAVDWLYAWTRNPMVLAAFALLFSMGIWFQSALFVFWTLIVFAPALLFFVKVYEERELEIRFGASYLEYKARTPMLFPRKPRKQKIER